MKKTFKLQIENKNSDRILESIKHEVRKYIKREQKKPLPEDKNYWFFDCKFAKEDEEPTEIQFSEIIKSINEAAEAKCQTFYLEILSRAEKRVKKEIIIEEDEVETEAESETETETETTEETTSNEEN